MGKRKDPADRRITFGCSLPVKTLKEVDQMRGMVPRTRYLEVLIKEGMYREGIIKRFEQLREAGNEA